MTIAEKPPDSSPNQKTEQLTDFKDADGKVIPDEWFENEAGKASLSDTAIAKAANEIFEEEATKAS